MYWLKRAWKRVGAFFSQPVGTVLSLIVSIIVSAFLLPGDALRIRSLSQDDLVIRGVYSLVVFGIIVCLILIDSLLHVFAERERLKDLSVLAELRANGIDLWNKNSRITNVEDIKKAKDSYKEWEKNVLDVFKRVSPVRAAMWKKAGTYLVHVPHFHLDQEPLNDEHHKHIFLFKHMWETLGTHIDLMLANIERRE